MAIPQDFIPSGWPLLDSLVASPGSGVSLGFPVGAVSLVRAVDVTVRRSFAEAFLKAHPEALHLDGSGFWGGTQVQPFGNKSALQYLKQHPGEVLCPVGLPTALALIWGAALDQRLILLTDPQVWGITASGSLPTADFDLAFDLPDPQTEVTFIEGAGRWASYLPKLLSNFQDKRALLLLVTPEHYAGKSLFYYSSLVLQLEKDLQGISCTVKKSRVSTAQGRIAIVCP